MAHKTKTSRNKLALLALVVAIAEPLMTIPQIIQIWTAKSAAGVSLISWAGYVLTGGIWLAYGLKIRDKPLIISSVLWVVADGLVFLGALRFM